MPNRYKCKKLNIAIFGCGGTGSELAKLLQGNTLTLIDYDKIEHSNLNRQFLYTAQDCGKYKAKVAAHKIGCKYKVCRLEELRPEHLDGFDLILSCLDSVSSRMELNYLFKQSTAPLLVDCGVEGLQAHVKRVARGDACLYCIKELYSAKGEPHLCSLKDAGQDITSTNRTKILQSIIAKERENLPKDGGPHDDAAKRIVKLFNGLTTAELATTEFEVSGYLHQLVSNVCTINSICASLAIMMAFAEPGHDFVFYDGTAAPYFKKLRLERSPGCLVCNSTED